MNLKNVQEKLIDKEYSNLSEFLNNSHCSCEYFIKCCALAYILGEFKDILTNNLFINNCFNVCTCTNVILE